MRAIAFSALCSCLLALAVAPLSAKPVPPPPIEVGPLTLPQPPHFRRVEDKRERLVLQSDSKEAWCRLAVGQRELGDKAELTKDDCRKLAQTVHPYLQQPVGLRWRSQAWLGRPSYALEFSAVEGNRRHFASYRFTLRGGLLLWCAMICSESEKSRWVPIFESWAKTARWNDL